MQTVVTVVVILGLIALGVLLIHRLNVQQGYHISAERHDDVRGGRRPHHHHRRHGPGRGRPHPERRVTPPRDRRA
ncbi:hypothetical protein HUT19_13370 [Streptomyces sp. NA02950]|uniref:hypothetical protein n=1 Tax=Streptomyces sp. NA02950 TaxID=2742137 RepID=UPI0015925779|nr:hypothetical protein [Streptomyces sp. NA02950]QKV92618.1 hypothetical protein HUT19_13370 [Streptomyces sp. NA02950]